MRHARGAVMVVEDEATIAEVVARYLERAGYDTTIVRDGRAAVAAIKRDDPDLVLLDLMLPGLDGLEVMRQVRAGEDARPAIIMLTARGEETDRVVGLRLGADDYVVKPFSPNELLARVDAVLRRVERGTHEPPTLRFGELVIDGKGRRATIHGEDLALTQREFDLLAFLASHPGRAFSRDELMDRVWHHAFFTDSATVTVHVRRLRAKLGDPPEQPRWIETVWGVGYRFAA